MSHNLKLRMSKLLLIFATLLSFYNAMVIEKPTPPKYIIIASRQRSSSTTLTRMIASHSCVLDGNEVWNVYDKDQDKQSAHDYVNMNPYEIRKDPGVFLSLAHEGICQTARDNGSLHSQCDTCTVVVKLFDIHGIENVTQLFEYTEFGFVVLERPIEGQWCSLKKAEATNDWATTPGGHKVVDYECDDVPEQFRDRIQKWYDLLRSGLKDAGRFYMEIPFSVIASCNLSRLIPTLYSEFGLELSNEITLPSDLEELFRYC